ncbi:hypothetical protein [Streptomyces decoyicus]
MTTNERLPQRKQTRTPQDRIRRASIADGAFNGFPPVDWVRLAGASVSETLMVWECGELARLPVGIGWDVVRMPAPAGWKAVQQLQHLRVAVGPVLLAQDSVEFLLPVQSVEDWYLPEARVLARGEHIEAPHPVIVAPRTQNAHSWIVPPQVDLVLTDDADLYAAHGCALAMLEETKDTAR